MRILGGDESFNQVAREIGSFHAKGEPDTKVFDGYVYTCLRSKEEFVSTMEMNILIGTRLADSLPSFIDKVILIITLTPPLFFSLSHLLSIREARHRWHRGRIFILN